MTVFVLIGGTAGLGLCAVVAGLSRTRAPLAAILRWHEDAGHAIAARSVSSPPGGVGNLSGGRPAVEAPVLERLGNVLTTRLASRSGGESLRKDLALLGRTWSAHSSATALAAIAGAAIPIALYGAGGLLGLGVPFDVTLLAAGALASGAALIPSLQVRRAAAAERASFLHALSCWLELVALAQAGGMGIEGALEAASSVSDEGTFRRLRLALDRARRTGRSPWQALTALGRSLGIVELEELAASVGLAGTEGARIRASLTAKSDSLRHRQMSQAESRANETTERLFVPAIVLMIAFMLFLVFPAASTVSQVLL